MMFFNYNVEWYWDTIDHWMLYDICLTKKGACRAAVRHALKKRTVSKWRVINYETQEVVMEINVKKTNRV